MLTIRNEQIAILDLPQRQSFVDKTLLDLVEIFPEDPRVRDESKMRVMIENAISHAGSFGIESTREVSLFVFLVQELGPKFEQAPENKWMKTILGDNSMRASAKLDVLYARLESTEQEDHS